MDRATYDHDRRAREVLQAVAPLLRHRLGVPELDPDLVGDLYLRLRDALAYGDARGGAEAATAPDLAWTIYLVLASHPLGSGPRPDLLVSLRRTLARSTDLSGGPIEVPSKGPERRGSR